MYSIICFVFHSFTVRQRLSITTAKVNKHTFVSINENWSCVELLAHGINITVKPLIGVWLVLSRKLHSLMHPQKYINIKRETEVNTCPYSKVLHKPYGPLGKADLHFSSPQQNTSLHQ